MSTISFADMYGAGAGLGRPPGATEPSASEKASGATEISETGDKTPAFSWLGMVMALVLLRVLWEMS